MPTDELSLHQLVKGATYTGKKLVSSATEQRVAYATEPTCAYAIRAPRGPARCIALPEPRNRPVPIVPAIYKRFKRVCSGNVPTLLLTAILVWESVSKGVIK